MSLTENLLRAWFSLTKEDLVEHNLRSVRDFSVTRLELQLTSVKNYEFCLVHANFIPREYLKKLNRGGRKKYSIGTPLVKIFFFLWIIVVLCTNFLLQDTWLMNFWSECPCFYWSVLVCLFGKRNDVECCWDLGNRCCTSLKPINLFEPFVKLF